ncbi:uncharacterized protein LOC134183456 isoform X4 [Corticium candelabrum]|uniref:uncharacterized protein LOC134183456 isoform X4 n=1 Tax=Corticium candelabrum TaxID=121492 RepID=UPI002E275130|nr:uncharacterized protein LOC134183456 isoform X4 [Corticium candelabrum]
MSIWADRKHATAKSAKTLPALEGTLVSIYPINTGYLCVSRASLVEGGSPNEILQIPCFAFLLHHPVEGFVLFDIGIPSRFLPDEDLAERKMKPDSPRFFPTVTKGMNVNSQLAQAGIESLDKVILSHSMSDFLIQTKHSSPRSHASPHQFHFCWGWNEIEAHFKMVRSIWWTCQDHVKVTWESLPELKVPGFFFRDWPYIFERTISDYWVKENLFGKKRVYASYEPALLEELGDQFLLQDFAKRTSGYWQYVAPDTK